MKYLIVALGIFLSTVAESNSPQIMNENVLGEYGIHLFFTEEEFIDTLHFSMDENGNLQGFMDVPNDFAGYISELKIEGLEISFDLFVPKNRARPQDLVFHYRGEFFDESLVQLKGFVTLKGEDDFVASFLGFKRN